MIRAISHQTRQDRADQTRKFILRAAVREFSTYGFSGARTDAIAKSANVNKALLYYYFKNKQSLYAAALEEVSGKVVSSALDALDSRHSAGERLLRLALNHFDRILTQHEFQSLMQQEMVRFQHGEGGSIPLLVRTAFKPLLEKLRDAVGEGVKTGELCEIDWLQVTYSMFGANVFYFLSAPMLQVALPFKPFDVDVLKSRREATVRFLGRALFADRVHGAQLAKHVLDAMPMPQIKKFQVRRKWL